MEREELNEQSPMPPTGQNEKRTRGAQPGNQNARKHGFYSKNFSPEVQEKLVNAAGIEGLDQEIALLRAKIAVAADDPAQSAFLLSGISLLSRLLRTSKELGCGKENSLQNAVRNILSDVPLSVAQCIKNIIEKEETNFAEHTGSRETNPDEYLTGSEIQPT